MQIRLFNEAQDEQLSKIFYPANQLWKNFLEIHQKSTKGPLNKASKALHLLVECILKYTTIITISDYLAHPERHDEHCNKLVERCLTTQKNYQKNCLDCLENLWKLPSFIAQFEVEHSRIIAAFNDILKFQFTKKNHQKEYANLLTEFTSLIPLLQKYNAGSFLYFEDYPWQESQGATVPVLNFMGVQTPEPFLKYLASPFYGAPGYFYFSHKQVDSLSLYPFIISARGYKSIYFFFRFRKKLNQVEYIDYVTQKKIQLSGVIVQEFQAICTFLHHSHKYGFSLPLRKQKSLEFFLPIESFDKYRETLHNFQEQNIGFAPNLILNLSHSFGKIFIYSFIHKACEVGIVKTMAQVGFCKQAVAFLDIIFDRTALNHIQEILEGLILHQAPETQTVLKRLWRHYATIGDTYSQISLLEWWTKYDWQQAVARFSDIKELYQEEASRAILKSLLETHQYAKVMKVYDALHKRVPYHCLLNDEIGPGLLEAFIEQAPQRCFEICQQSLNTWDMAWLDKVIEKLLELSVAKTVDILCKSTLGYEDFDVSCWERLYNAYQIISKKQPEKLQSFINHVEEPISSLRLRGLDALYKKEIKVFEHIVQEVSDCGNLEHSLSTLCFFAHMLRKDIFANVASLEEKILKQIKEQTYALFNFLGTYHVKNECTQLLGRIEPAEIIHLSRKISENMGNYPKFSIFLSYLLAKNLIDITHIQELIPLFSEKPIKNAPIQLPLEEPLDALEEPLDALEEDFPTEEEIFFLEEDLLPQQTLFADFNDKFLGNAELMLDDPFYKDYQDLENFDEGIEEETNLDHNTINQLLAELAAVVWQENPKKAIYYLSQLIPDTLFDKEDACKKVIIANNGISLKNLFMFVDIGCELESLQIFWLEKKISEEPHTILNLYKNVSEELKTCVVSRGLPQLLSLSPAKAVALVDQLEEGISFDFSAETGNIFLEIYRHNTASGKKFLRFLNSWDMARGSETGQSLIQAFTKLSLKKLVDLYEELVFCSQGYCREEIALLLLCAIIPRKPAYSIRGLLELTKSLPEESIEEMVQVLIYELAAKKLELARELLSLFYSYVQKKEFLIKQEEFARLQDAIVSCVTQKPKWAQLPDIYIHRWILFPQVLGKLCHKMLFVCPERALLFSRYLVGKPEIFLLLGDPPFEIINEEFAGIFEVTFSPYELFNNIDLVHSQTLTMQVENTVARLTSTQLANIMPYFSHPLWSKKQRDKLLSAVEKNLPIDFPIAGKFSLAIAHEIGDFNRISFETSLKDILQDLAQEDIDIFDLERKIFSVGFQVLLLMDKSFLKEIGNIYWDQMDFIAPILAHLVESPQEQITWLQKIISVEERLETLEQVTINNYLVKKNKASPEFIKEIAKIVEEAGSFELTKVRVVSVFILLFLNAPKKTMNIIKNISDEEMMLAYVEAALEFLVSEENFSEEIYQKVWPWFCNSSMDKKISLNNLFYFYCQLAQRLLESSNMEAANEVIARALSLSFDYEERERKYYLEDLVPLLIKHDYKLAWDIVKNFPDNEEYFIEIVVAWAKNDLEEALEIAQNHSLATITHLALKETACYLAQDHPLQASKIMAQPEMHIYVNEIAHALAISATKKGENPQKYLQKIVDPNQKFQTYCEMAGIYREKKQRKNSRRYINKVWEMIEKIDTSTGLLGVTLAWPSGASFEMSSKFLRDLSKVDVAAVLKVFELYCSQDRFIDVDDAVHAIFDEIAKKKPEQILFLLEKVDNFDISLHKHVVIEQARKDPLQAIAWLLATQQLEFCSLVFDKVKNKKLLSECLLQTLNTNFSHTQESYLSQIITLIPYCFKVGGYGLLLEILQKLQSLCSLQKESSLKQLLQTMEQKCQQWEKKEKQRYFDEKL